MADIIDTANDLVAARIQDEIERNKAFLRDMPQGAPGECRDCGEHTLRAVGGRCAPCREEPKKKVLASYQIPFKGAFKGKGLNGRLL